MRMYPYFHKVGIDPKALLEDNRGELGTILILPIMMIISLFVVATMGSALIPSAVTTASNLSASSATGGNGTAGNPYTGGYSSWSSPVQSAVSAVPSFLGINYMMIYIIILLFGVALIAKAAS